MENQDKIESQFKNAAQKMETKEVPSMDKIWNRVEEKLDQKVLKKENKLWKKIAVAASILLVASVAYQFLKPTSIEIEPTNEVVSKDTVNSVINSIKTDSTAVTYSSPIIKENAADILQQEINNKAQVVVTDAIVAKQFTPMLDSVTSIKGKSRMDASKANSSAWFENEAFEARGVKQAEKVKVMSSKKNEEIQKERKKQDPIMVLDGKITSENLYELDDSEIESIIELKEPLYIINSIYYTEKELFGPNPTSPYSPLNKQKIETFTILQPEKAVKIYGKKGEKGIVIVTTKDGKPLPKKE